MTLTDVFSPHMRHSGYSPIHLLGFKSISISFHGSISIQPIKHNDRQDWDMVVCFYGVERTIDKGLNLVSYLKKYSDVSVGDKPREYNKIYFNDIEIGFNAIDSIRQNRALALFLQNINNKSLRIIGTISRLDTELGNAILSVFPLVEAIRGKNDILNDILKGEVVYLKYNTIFSFGVDKNSNLLVAPYTPP